MVGTLWCTRVSYIWCKKMRSVFNRNKQFLFHEKVIHFQLYIRIRPKLYINALIMIDVTYHLGGQFLSSAIIWRKKNSGPTVLTIVTVRLLYVFFFSWLYIKFKYCIYQIRTHWYVVVAYAFVFAVIMSNSKYLFFIYYYINGLM